VSHLPDLIHLAVTPVGADGAEPEFNLPLQVFQEIFL